MPLCNFCLKESDYESGQTLSLVPPFGMKWGETCSRCGSVAEVQF